MFVRKKPNPSGIVSVQVIDKSLGKYRVVKTVGSSSDPEEIEQLVTRGKSMIAPMHGQQLMDFKLGDKDYKTSWEKAYLQKATSTTEGTI